MTATAQRARSPIPPPPFPIERARCMEYLSLSDVAGFMRKSLGAVKKYLDGRPHAKKEDEVGKALRTMQCKPFGRGRYIKAKAFIEWYLSRGQQSA